LKCHRHASRKNRQLLDLLAHLALDLKQQPRQFPPGILPVPGIPGVCAGESSLCCWRNRVL